MKKLWPPTYNNFTKWMWALGLSILLNAFAVAWLFLRKDFSYIWWYGFPGFFVFMPIAGGGIEEVDGWRAWCGLAAWVITNFLFYYFVARYFISAFQPTKSWWPEKRS